VEQHIQKGKVLMVTSVMENEGKSTVSANLALAMARKYSKVLLVDLDLHKPACRKILDQETPEYWTHDVINGTVSLEGAVKTDSSAVWMC
jgi:Mrp family chromosome partitioning ATPase